jgi:copper chaperone NosL
MLLVWCALFVACGGVGPAPYDPSYSCATCRMSVSDVHFAAQIVAPGEEPRFFDDIGCLARALSTADLPDGAIAFVADHRTGEWVKAEGATYTRVDTLATPMGSHLVAHADISSRDQDGAAAGGTAVAVRDALGRPGGTHAK